MGRSFGGGSVALAILLCSAMAAGQQGATNLAVTDTATGEYRGDNANGVEEDDEYGVLINRFNLQGNAGEISTGLRVDTTYFFSTPGDAYQDDIARLERLTAIFRPSDWTILAGDYFLQLGRGIALSLRKVDEMGLDVAIRGGQLQYSGRDHRAMLFAGLTNPANMDAISQTFVEDADDLLAGLSYEFRGLSFANIELFGVYLEPEERVLEEERDYTVSGGLSWNMPTLADWLAIYLEGDVQHRSLAGLGEQGYAGYLTADLTFQDTLLLIEGLYLDRFEQRGSRNTALGVRYDYNQAPTLERIDQEVIENRDVIGGHLRIEQYLPTVELTLYLDGMIRVNHPGEASELRQIHGFGGFELTYQQGASRLAASGGWRDESQDTGQVKSMIHAELDYLQSLTRRWSLHLTSSNEFRTLTGERFERGTTLAGFERAGLGAVTFEFGYDTQNRSEGVRNFFYAGILTWQIAERFRLRALGGTQRGGIKCIAGVCRDFPEFAGARLELVSRF
ncbi:MAG: hypothetical protein JW797_10180 [Bradymonadales bacterium]|nr:hypothetical protein [Bradymonadales bacterium]